MSSFAFAPSTVATNHWTPDVYVPDVYEPDYPVAIGNPYGDYFNQQQGLYPPMPMFDNYDIVGGPSTIIQDADPQLLMDYGFDIDVPITYVPTYPTYPSVPGTPVMEPQDHSLQPLSQHQIPLPPPPSQPTRRQPHRKARATKTTVEQTASTTPAKKKSTKRAVTVAKNAAPKPAAAAKKAAVKKVAPKPAAAPNAVAASQAEAPLKKEPCPVCGVKRIPDRKTLVRHDSSRAHTAALIAAGVQLSEHQKLLCRYGCGASFHSRSDSRLRHEHGCANRHD